MNRTIKLYNETVTKVKFFFNQLKIKIGKSTGRKLAINPEDTVALSVFQHSQGIITKKSVWEMFELKCSYKTFVVNVNKLFIYALLFLNMILKENQKNAGLVKLTDSTDIPVCLNKNAKYCKTMKAFSSWGHSGKGLYYGLKMSITIDLGRNLLAIKFATGGKDDRITFREMNKDLMGIFVADAGYISEKLQKDFYIENKRILFVKPKANMKKIITGWQKVLYDTRMLIELNFRDLKMFRGLITSLPRSINGYLANYVYSLLSHVLG